MSMKTKGALALIGSILMVSLAACSSGAGDTGGANGTGSGSQSTADACEIISTDLAAQVTAVTEKYADLAPEDITLELLVEDQKASLAEMDRILGKVGNAEVKAAFSEVVETARAGLPLMEKVLSDPMASTEIVESQEFIEHDERATKATEAFEAVCPGALPTNDMPTP